MIIIPGPASQSLGIKIGKILKSRIANVYFKEFPDKESYIRIEEDLNDIVVIVQSTYYPQERHFFQLLQMADIAARKDAKKIIAVIPYMAYSRQDKIFLSGEALSAAIVKKILESTFDEVITVDIHSDLALPKNGVSLSAFNLLYKTSLKYANNPLVILPDEGAKKRFKYSNMEVIVFEKYRDRKTGEITLSGEVIGDSDIVIIDDIISTGGTMAKSIEIIRRSLRSNRKIIVAATHALMIGSATERILLAGADKIISTDTIPNEFSIVSVSVIIADYLSKKYGSK